MNWCLEAVALAARRTGAAVARYGHADVPYITRLAVSVLRCLDRENQRITGALHLVDDDVTLLIFERELPEAE